jgi:glycosidase
VAIHYLRASPDYGGWGLHLWGGAIAASVATTWAAPRSYDAVHGGAAVFTVPAVDQSQALNFIVHNGDLKSPLPALRWWLNRGADGFRFDAVGVLFENGPNAWENAPDNHGLLAQLQSLINVYGKRFLVCEGPSAPEAYAAPSSCGRAFAFQATTPLYSSVAAGRVDAGLANFLANPLADSMPLIVGNHDAFAGERTWSRLSGDQAAYRLLAASYLLTSRSPFTYYGEDVGLAGGTGLSGDAALRTPLSWTTDSATAGFSTVAPFRALSANSTTQNVATGLNDAGSLLQHYRALLNLRKSYPVLGSGSLSSQSAPGESVLRLTRESATECAAIFVNYASSAQAAAVNTSCASAGFTGLFGVTGNVNADSAGRLTVTVPARSAAALRAVH